MVSLFLSSLEIRYHSQSNVVLDLNQCSFTFEVRMIVRKICLALFREIPWIKENVYVFEICLLWFSFLIWSPCLLGLCNWRVYRITKFIDFLFQCIHIVLLNDHIFANESETSYANCQRNFFSNNNLLLYKRFSELQNSHIWSSK